MNAISPLALAEDPRVAAVRGMTLAWWAARQPDQPAVTAPGGDRTFAQLNAGANRLARALRRKGLRPGDAVALLCTNRPEFVETVYACQRSGWRLTPINWHLTGDEAGYILANCEAKAVVADGSLAAAAAVAVVVAPALGVRLATGGDIAGFDPYADVVDAETDDDVDDPVLGTHMLYTSGTTGRPKGVYRSPELARTLAAVGPVDLYGYVPGGVDTHLCTGPLYHAAPLAFSLTVPLAFGVGTVLMERWDAEEALELIERHHITHSHMVPTMFHRLLALPEEVRTRPDLSSLRQVVHGAAPCPVGVKQRLIDWLGPIVLEYYAATEGSGSWVDSPTWLAHPGTVGKPLEDGQVMVADPDGQPVPAGQIGMLYLRAPATGRFEYFKDPTKTDGAYRGDYFTLGDMGYFDDEGFLYLTDRSANLIISGGVNIYPAEVDAALLEHPDVADAAVIGIPSEEWGEEVKAVVELRAGVVGDARLAGELMAFCRARLAHFKCPRSVDFITVLPRQDNGKIYKRLLRDQYRSPAA